jgi:small subunit ribosomal protein S2
VSAVVTMKQLLEAGVHFGHQTRRWNPKMKRFIHGERGGIYLIDLHQTLSGIEKAYLFVRDLVADGGTILFIGTKKQAQDSIQGYAEKCGMPYINQRWLGGMLTNFETISKRVAKMKEYQRMRDSGEFDAMPKKEALLLTRELDKLERNLNGIRDLERLPDAVFILDTKKEDIAVTEANKLGIPVVAVVDTNCDPDVVQYVIPGNDDAIRSGNLLTRVIADAVIEGKLMRSKKHPESVPRERSAEEQAEKAAEQARAAAEARQAAAEREARILAARNTPGDEGAVRNEAIADSDVVATAPVANELAARELAADGQPAEASPVTPHTEEH